MALDAVPDIRTRAAHVPLAPPECAMTKQPENTAPRVPPPVAPTGVGGLDAILHGGPPRYHAEVVTLRQLFAEAGCTVLFLADHPAETEQGTRPEVAFHPIAGCVIHLEQEPRPYGDVRRRLRVVKARGLPHNGGYHDLKIRPGKIEVYPRLGAYNIPESREYRQVKSGVKTLDKLLGGGLEEGTACRVVGPSGTGKS